MATHFREICLAPSQPYGQHVCQFPFKCLQNVEIVCSLRVTPQFLARICCYHGNILSATFENMSRSYLHLNVNRCAKFDFIWVRNMEVVQSPKFFPIFGHNMWLPWQHTFHHFKKMCLAHIHLMANMCAKFYFKRFKNVEAV